MEYMTKPGPVPKMASPYDKMSVKALKTNRLTDKMSHLAQMS